MSIVSRWIEPKVTPSIPEEEIWDEDEDDE